MNKKRYLVLVGVMVAVVAISTVLHTTLANHQPTVISVRAPEKVLPLESCEIMCHATDPDGDDDALGYDWSASGGDISGTGASVNWTAPDSGGYYKVTVTVTDSRGGEVASEVTITVGVPPVITDLAADANWVIPSETVQVTCNATDPDGDELSYEWTTSAGSISGTGAVVGWTAPQEVGIYDITVVVKDTDGDSVSGSLDVSVATEQPPLIQTLRITKDRYGHCYLKQSGEKYLVGKEQKYDIECIVSDTSTELFYEWSCTAGEISGEGGLITWTAPNTTVETTVTAVVSDIAGNMFARYIVLDVVACSRCTFGC